MTTTNPPPPKRADERCPPHRGPGPRLCTVPGCDRTHYGRGLCRAHHQRWRRTGDPGPAAIPPNRAARTCTVDGCDQPHQARGYCRTHYSRWKRTGGTQTAHPPDPRTCALPGCGQRHYRRGLCHTHYRRSQAPGGALPALDVTACAQLYSDGATAPGLARLYSRTPRTILAALRTEGIPIRPPGRHPRRPTH